MHTTLCNVIHCHSCMVYHQPFYWFYWGRQECVCIPTRHGRRFIRVMGPQETHQVGGLRYAFFKHAMITEDACLLKKLVVLSNIVVVDGVQSLYYIVLYIMLQLLKTGWQSHKGAGKLLSNSKVIADWYLSVEIAPVFLAWLCFQHSKVWDTKPIWFCLTICITVSYVILGYFDRLSKHLPSITLEYLDHVL